MFPNQNLNYNMTFCIATVYKFGIKNAVLENKAIRKLNKLDFSSLAGAIGLEMDNGQESSDFRIHLREVKLAVSISFLKAHIRSGISVKMFKVERCSKVP